MNTPPSLPKRDHRAGTFIEGFDSILYNTERRGGNQVRFLAEAFYGLIFDSHIVLAEPMVFDNFAVIRLLHKLKERKQEPLHRVFSYAHFRQPLDTVAKTLMNPAYVASCLSPSVEACRIDFARKLAGSGGEPGSQAESLLEFLLGESCASDDDKLYLSSLLRGVRHGDWLWTRAYAGNTQHGFKMSDELSRWLQRDAARELEITPPGQVPAPLSVRISQLLEDAQFWPAGEAPNGYNTYFAGRSRFHQKHSLWQEALGKWDFDRLDEYVNSAYMIAIQRTCEATSAVRTPMDFNNAGHIAAQQVMHENSESSLHFEFRLNLSALSGYQTGGEPAISPDKLRCVEDGMLDCLNELEKTPEFTTAKKMLSTLTPGDEDYTGRYGAEFSKLVRITNKVGGPFRLMIEGNRVVTILEDAGTQVSRCDRELDAAQEVEGANGCESRDAAIP